MSIFFRPISTYIEVDFNFVPRLSLAEGLSALFADVYTRRRKLSMPRKLSTQENYHLGVRKCDLTCSLLCRTESFFLGLLSKGNT